MPRESFDIDRTYVNIASHEAMYARAKKYLSNRHINQFRPSSKGGRSASLECTNGALDRNENAPDHVWLYLPRRQGGAHQHMSSTIMQRLHAVSSKPRGSHVGAYLQLGK